MNRDSFNKITHSVLCITYNQEDYIEKAISSLFSGNVWPDEVVIFDDCSTDRTRQKIEGLILRFPERIRAVFNSANLGICGNLNQLVGCATKDMVHLLAGDDWEEPGMFERMNQEIESRGLDPRFESFMLIPDFFFYDGNSLTRFFNSKESIRNGFLKATLRQQIAHRMVGVSRKLFDHFPEYDETLGVWADFYHMVDFSRYCEQVYFIDQAYPVYRLGVGVTSKESWSQKLASFLAATHKIKTEMSASLDKDDLNYLDYLIAMNTALLSPSLAAFVKYIYLFALNYKNGARLCDLKSISRHTLNVCRDIFSGVFK